MLGGGVVRLQAWVFEKKHPRLAHDGVAHDCVARNVVGAGVVCVEAEHRLIEVIPDFVGWGILVWLLALLLLKLTLTRSARHGGSRCGSVESVLSFTLACLEEDDASGNAGDG